MTVEKKEKMDRPSDNFERVVHSAMRHAGLLVPQTIDEVLHAEKLLNLQANNLPPGLADPSTIFVKQTRTIKIEDHIKGVPDAEVDNFSVD